MQIPPCHRANNTITTQHNRQQDQEHQYPTNYHTPLARARDPLPPHPPIFSRIYIYIYILLHIWSPFPPIAPSKNTRTPIPTPPLTSSHNQTNLQKHTMPALSTGGVYITHTAGAGWIPPWPMPGRARGYARAYTRHMRVHKCAYIRALRATPTGALPAHAHPLSAKTLPHTIPSLSLNSPAALAVHHPCATPGPIYR